MKKLKITAVKCICNSEFASSRVFPEKPNPMGFLGLGLFWVFSSKDNVHSNLNPGHNPPLKTLSKTNN
jgi:hypothetical protein